MPLALRRLLTDPSALLGIFILAVLLDQTNRWLASRRR
jgi:hypothetical protein